MRIPSQSTGVTSRSIAVPVEMNCHYQSVANHVASSGENKIVPQADKGSRLAAEELRYLFGIGSVYCVTKEVCEGWWPTLLHDCHTEDVVCAWVPWET